MESNRVKVLDNGHRTVVGSRMKVASQYNERLEKLSFPSNLSSSYYKLGKRKRTVDRESNCHSSKSILKNYSNFMKSGLPQRVLFYKNGEWNDFSEDIVRIVREDFQAKKAVIEVKFGGCHIMLDVLYMVQVDLITGLQKPIAWIDEAGGCFFPELGMVSCKMHDNLEIQSQRTKEFVAPESDRETEIKLHLEIDVNGLKTNNLEECVEESNVGAKRIKVSPVKDDQEFSDDNISGAKMEQVAENQQNEESLPPNLETILKLEDTESVKNMFFMGMNAIPKVDIINISKCSSNHMRTRLELFEKQVEITQKYRGNSNVRHAWLAASKEGVSTIMKYGLAHGAPEQKIKLGVGVHLSALHCASKSATSCDVDENGISYMVLCRVILGNAELLHCGSKQYHPSDEIYDTGIDDLENPSYYVVWNMNLHTHIYPEYVVSFRMSRGAEGAVFGKEIRFDVSGVTSQGSEEQVGVNKLPTELGKNGQQYQIVNNLQQVQAVVLISDNPPKSPWLPFPILFRAISAKVPPADMRLVYAHYDLFRSNKINRNGFVTKMRLIVGDQLLKSTLNNLKCKPVIPPCS